MIARSPIEAVHAALGATWVGEDARWPTAYGETRAEAAAAAAGAGLAEIGPIQKVAVRGRRTVEALAAEGTPFALGAVTAGPSDGVGAWCLATDEVLLLAPRPGFDPLVARLQDAGAAVADVSSGFAVLRLLGPATPALLERAGPVDLSPRALQVDRIAQAALVGVRMVVARQDHGDLPGYTLLVARDLAGYAWDALLDLGRDLGLVPIGAMAAAGMRP